jgi:GTP pyrophosphokinase
VRAQYKGLGRKMVESAFARSGKPFSDERLAAVLPRLARASAEDVFAAVGRGEIKVEDVQKAVDPEWRATRKAKPRRPARGDGWFGMKFASGLKFRIPGFGGGDDDAPHVNAIPIRGMTGELPVRFAPDGGAVPGDRIVGILTPGEGITVYPIQSPALKAFDDEPERWLDVRWDVEGDGEQRFPARITVSSANEPGSLAQIAQVIAEHGGNIDNIRLARGSPDFTEMLIDVEVYDLKHLNAIIAQLRGRPAVSHAARVNG